MPFFIRPYQAREEDKRVLDKEMKTSCYLGILKEGFSAYSIPVMLVTRKLTQDKSSNRFLAFKHQNCQKQPCISFSKGCIYNIGKF